MPLPTEQTDFVRSHLLPEDTTAQGYWAQRGRAGFSGLARDQGISHRSKCKVPGIRRYDRELNTSLRSHAFMHNDADLSPYAKSLLQREEDRARARADAAAGETSRAHKDPCSCRQAKAAPDHAPLGRSPSLDIWRARQHNGSPAVASDGTPRSATTPSIIEGDASSSTAAAYQGCGPTPPSCTTTEHHLQQAPTPPDSHLRESSPVQLVEHGAAGYVHDRPQTFLSGSPIVAADDNTPHPASMTTSGTGMLSAADVFTAGDTVVPSMGHNGHVTRTLDSYSEKWRPQGKQGHHGTNDALVVVRKLSEGTHTCSYLVRTAEAPGACPSIPAHTSTTSLVSQHGAVRDPKAFELKCLCKHHSPRDLISGLHQQAWIHQFLPSHEKILTICCAFETPDHLFLMADYCPGSQDLYYWLEEAQGESNERSLLPNPASETTTEGPCLRDLPLLAVTSGFAILSWRRLQLISSLFQQMCSAVQFCHDHGIAHRALKPESFIVQDRRNYSSRDAGGPSAPSDPVMVKLSDFSLATEHERCCDFNYGSRPYMSYECCNRIESTYDPKLVDVWSLGITLLNMLFHRSPFQAPDINLCSSYRAFRQDPEGFILSAFDGLTPTVASLLATRVFTDASTGQRASVAELAAWSADLCSHMGAFSPNQPIALSRGASMGITTPMQPSNLRAASIMASSFARPPPSALAPLLNRNLTLCSRPPSQSRSAPAPVDEIVPATAAPAATNQTSDGESFDIAQAEDVADPSISAIPSHLLSPPVRPLHTARPPATVVPAATAPHVHVTQSNTSTTPVRPCLERLSPRSSVRPESFSFRRAGSAGTAAASMSQADAGLSETALVGGPPEDAVDSTDDEAASVASSAKPRRRKRGNRKGSSASRAREASQHHTSEGLPLPSLTTGLAPTSFPLSAPCSFPPRESDRPPNTLPSKPLPPSERPLSWRDRKASTTASIPRSSLSSMRSGLSDDVSSLHSSLSAPAEVARPSYESTFRPIRSRTGLQPISEQKEKSKPENGNLDASFLAEMFGGPPRSTHNTSQRNAPRHINPRHPPLDEEFQFMPARFPSDHAYHSGGFSRPKHDAKQRAGSDARHPRRQPRGPPTDLTGTTSPSRNSLSASSWMGRATGSSDRDSLSSASGHASFRSSATSPSVSVPGDSGATGGCGNGGGGGSNVSTTEETVAKRTGLSGKGFSKFFRKQA